MLELLENSLIKAASAIVVVPLVILAVLIAVVLLLRYLLMPRPDVLNVEKLKHERYEAGNPPLKEPGKGRMSMQYLGYLIMFLAVEPAIILLALTLTAPRELTPHLGKLYLVLIAVYAPLLYYALREAREVSKWLIE